MRGLAVVDHVIGEVSECSYIPSRERSRYSKTVLSCKDLTSFFPKSVNSIAYPSRVLQRMATHVGEVRDVSWQKLLYTSETQPVLRSFVILNQFGCLYKPFSNGERQE